VQKISRGKSGESTLTHVNPSSEAQFKQSFENHSSFLGSKANLPLSLVFLKKASIRSEDLGVKVGGNWNKKKSTFGSSGLKRTWNLSHNGIAFSPNLET
jgi:hypothetical protein